MGWTSFNLSGLSKHNTKKQNNEVILDWFINDQYREDKFTVLKASIVGSAIYAAIKFKEPDADKNKEPEVYAAVYLISTNLKDYYNFSYKDMVEAMGPVVDDCPTSILNLLTPTDVDYANNWRKRCKDKKKQKAEMRKTLKNIDYRSLTGLQTYLKLKECGEGFCSAVIEKFKQGYTVVVTAHGARYYGYPFEEVKKTARGAVFQQQ